MLKIIIDTNVVVSALIRQNSIPALMLSLVLQGKCLLCLSEDIFVEYEEVLARDKFRSLNKKAVAKILRELKQHALWTKAKVSIECRLPDEADKIFLECALAADADYIITGNKKHFPFDNFKNCQIVNPREFIAQLMEL